eukprot:1936491-Prymnesium_polylepis.1
MSSSDQLSAVSLVLDFLEAKKFDDSAKALRKDLEAMHAALSAPGSPEKPAEREFSQLESLL